MRISAILTPSEIVHLPDVDLSATTVVVFDVLRATSTMITALAHGAEAIYPARDIDEARALLQIHPRALLGGERHGEKILGFDLGNSPLEYLDLAGRQIISTTTNGTLALRAVAHAGCVIAGALLNIQAIANRLVQNLPTDLLLVCAGTGQEFAIEDGLGAGVLIQTLQKAKVPDLSLDDAAKTLLSLTQMDTPVNILTRSKNGSRLIERGRLAEVEWCSRIDACNIIAVLRDGALRVDDLAS